MSRYEELSEIKQGNTNEFVPNDTVLHCSETRVTTKKGRRDDERNPVYSIMKMRFLRRMMIQVRYYAIRESLEVRPISIPIE